MGEGAAAWQDLHPGLRQLAELSRPHWGKRKAARGRRGFVVNTGSAACSKGSCPTAINRGTPGGSCMDEAWMATIQKALSQRWPKSRRGGRPGTPVAVGCAGWG